jgi:ribosome-binding ATPase
MGIACGIVGLPNVGKSTLFNALTSNEAEASNYPFCTIDPNVGVVPVPDERLRKLAAAYETDREVPTTVEFVDIAGLVKGASKGEGLGNQFLGNIRAVDAVAHVVRCFDDENVVHVHGGVDPLADIDVINTELILKDVDSVDKRIDTLQKKVRANDKDAKAEMDVMEALRVHLDQGRLARTFERNDRAAAAIRSLQLLTDKPVMYVANVGDPSDVEGNKYVEAVRQRAAEEGSYIIPICAKIEAEIAQLDEEDRAVFLADLGMEEPGLNRVIRKAYELLGLITFFTAGKKETRAWTVRKQSLAPQAAGVIHTDFEKGFIRAEVMSYDDWDRLGSEQKVKDSGLYRVEGKDYVVKDGDIMYYRFNV